MENIESAENLQWLKEGETYRCVKALVVGEDPRNSPRLRESHRYCFESFSSDPLCDTRQYLFTDLDENKMYGVELTHEDPTPEWKSFLEPEL